MKHHRICEGGEAVGGVARVVRVCVVTGERQKKVYENVVNAATCAGMSFFLQKGEL